MSSDDARRSGPAVSVGSLHVREGATGVHVEIAHAPETRRSTLPNYRGSAPFTGRAKDLTAIAEAFARPGQQEVLVLHGAPGVGKSRLAVEYARTHQERYPGGAFFVSLDLTPPTDLAKLLDAFSLARGDKEPIEDQCRRALAHLATRPTLLIYDNVPDEEILSSWLPPDGLACDVLATSTSANWSASWSTHQVDPLDDDDARTLVDNVVRDRSAVRDWVDQLVTSARGITVELYAASKAVDYETRHGRRGSLRKSLAVDTTSSFERAWRILSEDAQLVLRTASLFETTRIPPEALRALWIPHEWSDTRFNAALDAAQDRTLVVATGKVLDMHPCIARFVREQSGPTISATIRRRHLDGFIDAASCFAKDPVNPQLGAGLRAYPANVQFWSVVLPGDNAALTEGAQTLGLGLHVDGRFDEARGWFERAVAAAEKGDVRGRVDPTSLSLSLQLVGSCCARTGRFDEARAWFERAVAVAEKEDAHGRIDPVSLGSSLHMIGYCYLNIGRYEEARGWFERAVSAAENGDMRGSNDPASLCQSLHMVGHCYALTERYEEALVWAERAVAEAEKGDVHGRVVQDNLGKILMLAGVCCTNTGRHDEALAWFERAIAAKEKGDAHGRIDHDSLGSSLHHMGSCHASTGRSEEARQWFERAVAATEKGDVYGRIDYASLGVSLDHVGECYVNTKRYEDARGWFERAVAAKEKGDMYGRVDPESMGRSLYQLGYCCAGAGRYEEARGWFERAVAEVKKGDVHGRINQDNLESAVRGLIMLEILVRSK